MQKRMPIPPWNGSSVSVDGGIPTLCEKPRRWRFAPGLPSGRCGEKGRWQYGQRPAGLKIHTEGKRRPFPVLRS
jgi:hypothetical protein